MQRIDDNFEVTCPVDAFTAVGEALESAGIETEAKELTRIPSNTSEVTDVETARTVLSLIETLDDHDDVQNVYANYCSPDEALAALNK